MNEHRYQTSNFHSSEGAPQHRIELQMNKCLDVYVQEHQSLASLALEMVISRQGTTEKFSISKQLAFSHFSQPS